MKDLTLGPPPEVVEALAEIKAARSGGTTFRETKASRKAMSK